MRKRYDEFRPDIAARKLIKQHDIRKLSNSRNTQLLSYNSHTGLYQIDHHSIEVAAQDEYLEHWGKSAKNHQINEIVSMVKRHSPLIRPEQINNPEEAIVIFKNGVFDLRSKELEAHCPSHLYTLGIPHDYPSSQPPPSCPVFDRFMQDILPNNAHQLIKQMLGYLLIPSTKFRKFFVFLGNGANGKSTLIKVIETMLGHDNVSHQSLHYLADNSFAAFSLFGKLANTYADLDDEDVKKAGLIKQIVAGDTIMYEQKFKDSFSGPVTARLLFSANTMPTIKDTSEAINDRLVLIDFPNRFVGEQDDQNLKDKLTTPQEMAGILTQWAIPGLLSLLEEGQFHITERSQALLRECRLASDPFLRFVEEKVEKAPDEWVGKEELYSVYELWCQWERGRPLWKTQFNRRSSEAFGISKDEDKRAPESRERIWQGIRLKARSSHSNVVPMEAVSHG